MIVHYLVGALRNLWQQKLSSLIYLLSMATGLAVFAFALLHVKQEYGYDRQWPDAERIHRLLGRQQGIPGTADTEFVRGSPPIHQRLAAHFADELDGITKLFAIPVQIGEERTTYGLQVADAGFPDVFGLEVVTGDLAQALENPGMLAISERMAATLPQGNTVGQRLLVSSEMGSPVEFEIAAVYRLPAPVSPQLEFQAITGMYDQVLPLLGNSNFNWNSSVNVWLKLKQGVTTEEFNAAQPAFIDQYPSSLSAQMPPGQRLSEHLFYRFQPVTALHFGPFQLEPGGDEARTLTVAVIGILVLLVACSNTLSLGLAAVLERRREIGIRKTSGAEQRDVAVQYLVEATLLTVLALLPAFALMEALRPLVTGMLNLWTMPPPSPGDYALLAAIAVAAGLLNSLYPAAVLAGVRPQQVLRPESDSHRSTLFNMRTLLVGFQFCFALMLLMGTLTLYKQLQFARQQLVGFSGENLLMLAFANAPADDVQRFAIALGELAGVEQILPGRMNPGQDLLRSTPMTSKEQGVIEVNVAQGLVMPGNFAMLQIPFLSGREFDAVRDQRDPQTGRFPGQAEDGPSGGRVILNRSAVAAFGFADAESALGKYLYRSGVARREGEQASTVEIAQEIIGVVEDSMLLSLKQRPGPEVYIYLDGPAPVLWLKYEDAVEATIMQTVNAAAGSFGFPRFSMRSVETTLQQAFQLESNETRLLLICAGLSLLLACSGLYGLVSYSMEKRIKEVGVRKVLGASTAALTRFYLWRYAIPVLLANVIAWPVAGYFILKWLQRFPYQLETWWLPPLFLTASAAVLVVAMLAVMMIVLRAAARRPVYSLRYE